MKSIGDRLKHARIVRGMTQEDLAAASDVKQGTISKLERNDQHKTTFGRILSQALQVDQTWLETGEGSMEPKIRVRDDQSTYATVPLELSQTLQTLGKLDTDELELLIDAIKLIQKARAARQGHQN